MKKWSSANICAYLSLAISTTILILWCCNVGGFTVVSLDSFVGVIVALLAIIVTIAIGWQINNSIELKEKIEKLSILEEKMTVQEQTIENNMRISQHFIYMILGYEENKGKKYTSAFRFFIKSLMFSMELNEPMHTAGLLNVLENCTNKIEEDSTYPSDKLKDVQKSNAIIRASSNYIFIKTQYEKIYTTFESKVRKEND